jgi:3-hydroxyacyl-CoA dehydrogenase/enoyl-CoA hydratase/3-hydroxybutyryl-CoA epimerase
MKTISYAVDAQGVALLTIDLPERPVNVFTPDFIADLGTAVEQVLADEKVVGAVITSAKSAFIVGADLSDLVKAYDKGMTPSQASKYFDTEMRLMRRIETGGKPFACAINGMALGGGLELALSCHWRVLADDGKALLGLPEVSVGLLPAGGGTQRLPRLIGIEKALPLLLDGTHIAPAKALQLGIVQALAPKDQLIEQARQWVLAHPGAQQPWDIKGFKVPGGVGALAPHAWTSFLHTTTQTRRAGADRYPAPLAILSAVYEGTQLPIDKALGIEAKYFGQLLAHPVARNLIRTLFLRKGEANKLTRRPAGVAPSKVAELGVLGAGMMGAGIAYSAAMAGIKVVLIDTTAQAAQNGQAYAAKLLDKAVERGTLARGKADEVLARIQPSTEHSALSNCNMVIEAVFEDRQVKADVTAKAEAHMKLDAVFASNTSTLSIDSLAERSRRPAQFVGLHFFSPVDKMPLVEVIRGPRTSDSALARALDLVAQLKKTPIVVNDGPAFYTTRVFCTFVDEGMQMLAEGVAPALIENGARLAGMPVGPLAVIDETTTSLRWKVTLQARADKLPANFSEPTGAAVCERMVTLGRFGRKAGGGFYDYPQGGRKQLWTGLKEEFPVAAAQPDPQEVVSRLLCIQALEAARCLEEGVLVNAHEGDLGSILGVGYPSWTGGALSYIDTVGIRAFVATCDALAQKYGARFAPSAWLRERAERNEPLVSNP